MTAGHYTSWQWVHHSDAHWVVPPWLFSSVLFPSFCRSGSCIPVSWLGKSWHHTLPCRPQNLHLRACLYSACCSSPPTVPKFAAQPPSPYLLMNPHNSFDTVVCDPSSTHLSPPGSYPSSPPKSMHYNTLIELHNQEQVPSWHQWQYPHHSLM